jgi:hypothetical protein
MLVIPVYSTWCYNEFSSDVIWIYVEASISGQNSLTSNGSGGVDSGLKISQCPSGFNYLQVKIFNDTFVATIYPEINQSINVFFPSSSRYLYWNCCNS